MSDDRLYLARDRWYGWQLLPGYTDRYDPYFSPIRVFHIEPLKTGHGILRLGFWNALYAEGVQDFQIDLKIRVHHPSYLVADLCYHSNHFADRSAIISAMSTSWLDRFCPFLVQGRRADTGDESDIELYLDRLFPGSAEP
jgi:hypothetical protein